MNFEEFEKTWTRQLIVGERISAQMVQHQLVREVRQRSGRVRRIIGVAAFVFVTGCAAVAVTHFTGIKPLDAVAARYLIITLIFDLLFFALALRSLRRNRSEEARMGESLLDAVRGSLRVVDWQMRDCRLLACGGSVALVGSLVFLLLKYNAGMLPLRGLVVGTVMDVVLAIAVALTVLRYYRRELLPRRDELRNQLQDIETGAVETAA